MRKRKTVFFDSLFAVGLSWGFTKYLNRSDQESVLLMASSLLLTCTFILIPVALRSIKTGRPVRGGIYFLSMLLPLVIAISHPAFSFHIAPFMSSEGTAETAGNCNFSQWGINLLLNGSVFFLTGYIFSKLNSDRQVSWQSTAFTTFILAVFYILSSYAAAQIFGKGWQI